MAENGIIVQVEGLALERNIDNSSMITERKRKYMSADAGSEKMWWWNSVKQKAWGWERIGGLVKWKWSHSVVSDSIQPHGL